MLLINFYSQYVISKKSRKVKIFSILLIELVIIVDF